MKLKIVCSLIYKDVLLFFTTHAMMGLLCVYFVMGNLILSVILQDPQSFHFCDPFNLKVKKKISTKKMYKIKKDLFNGKLSIHLWKAGICNFHKMEKI